MRTIWQILKGTAIDFWEEMLYMLLFNIIWLIGTLLIIPWPFVTFALFYITYDVNQGKGINLGKFLGYGRQMWKQAYLWGLINVVMFLVVWINLNFYTQFKTQWAAIIWLVILFLTGFWIVLQLIAVALYPRLIEPRYRLALRNALVLVGKYPVFMVVVILLLVVFMVISTVIPAFAMLVTFSGTAIFITNLVNILLKHEFSPQKDEARKS